MPKISAYLLIITQSILFLVCIWLFLFLISLLWMNDFSDSIQWSLALVSMILCWIYLFRHVWKQNSFSVARMIWFHHLDHKRVIEPLKIKNIPMQVFILNGETLEISNQFEYIYNWIQLQSVYIDTISTQANNSQNIRSLLFECKIINHSFDWTWPLDYVSIEKDKKNNARYKLWRILWVFFINIFVVNQLSEYQLIETINTLLIKNHITPRLWRSIVSLLIVYIISLVYNRKIKKHKHNTNLENYTFEQLFDIQTSSSTLARQICSPLCMEILIEHRKHYPQFWKLFFDFEYNRLFYTIDFLDYRNPLNWFLKINNTFKNQKILNVPPTQAEIEQHAQIVFKLLESSKISNTLKNISLLPYS